MLKTLFFGHLPLGWKRLFRGITFAWCVFFQINGFFNWNDGESFFYNIGGIFLLIGISVSMTLSYIINGFVLQYKKKDE